MVQPDDGTVKLCGPLSGSALRYEDRHAPLQLFTPLLTLASDASLRAWGMLVNGWVTRPAAGWRVLGG